MRINGEYCSKEAIEQAIAVVKGCYCTATPCYKMNKGFFTPGANGAGYGGCWWSLDYALIVDGAKWLDFSYATDFLDNMLSAQEADGRVRLYGTEYFGHIPNIQEEVGSLPKYLQTAYDIAELAKDEETVEKAYTLMTRGLGWWFGKRQDENTRLITAIFEETFLPNTVSPSMVYAPMDTNTEVYLGCKHCAALAKRLGKKADETFYLAKAEELKTAIDTYLWNEEDGCYYPFVLTEKRQYKLLASTTFLGLYFADGKKKARLLSLLTDHEHFHWQERPLTTLSKKDPLFTVSEGPYQGNPSWSGSVWTLTNVAVIRALRAAGEEELAKYLAIKTVEIFADNYAEFIQPFTGEGEGVARYGWTAGQFLQILIEIL